MNSNQTDTLISRAIDKAKQLDIHVCIAIVDSGALLQAFQRMDKAFKGSVDVAIVKARTSALFPMPSGDFGTLVREQQLTGMELSNNGLVAFAGGQPIVCQNEVLGAIGVSGGTEEQDDEIALYAINKLAG